jgi:hypothetical protein
MRESSKLEFNNSQNTSKKIPYTPPAEKRYAISRDPNTQERIEFVRDLQKKLTEHFGVEIGITLFGSITKGKDLSDSEIATMSDIDCNIFFDGDYVSEHYNEFLEKFPGLKNYQQPSSSDSLKYQELCKQLNFKYFLKNEIPKIIKLDSKMPQGLLEFEVIRTSTQHLEDIDYHLEQLNGGDGNYLTGMTPDMPDIAKLFQLDVGGVAPKYRAIFLKALSERDKSTKEKVWNLICFKIRSQERYGRGPGIKNLPKTFAEAYETYVEKKNKTIIK